jgi:hypothetical protein
MIPSSRSRKVFVIVLLDALWVNIVRFTIESKNVRLGGVQQQQLLVGGYYHFGHHLGRAHARREGQEAVHEVSVADRLILLAALSVLVDGYSPTEGCCA